MNKYLVHTIDATANRVNNEQKIDAEKIEIKDGSIVFYGECHVVVAILPCHCTLVKIITEDK